MTITEASIILAMLNCIEFLICATDWYYSSTMRNFVAAAAWFGSAMFWLARSVVPV